MAPEGQPFGRYNDPNTSATTPADGAANFYPTLAISEAEARVGTSRVLTLPDGRQVPVSIPPGVQNGQTIDLNDPGSAAGTLRLKLSVLTSQQAGPLSWPGQVSTGNTATFVNNAGGTVLDPAWTNPNNRMAAQSGPASIPDVSTFAMSGGASSGAGWANSNDLPASPPAQWQSGPSYFAPAGPPPSIQAPQPTKRSSSTLVLASVIVIVFLILGSAGLLYAFNSRGSGGTPNPTGTSTSNQANGATSTAQAYASATAQAQTQGTATAQANASGTAQAQGTAGAQANATATAAAINPYGGTLALNDPLTNNSQGHQWREYADSTTGASCQFTNGAYHIVMPGNFGGPCMGAATNFGNFAFQVQMSFSKEGQHFSGAGLAFRGDSSASKYYILEFFESGQYIFYSCSGNDCSHGIAGYPNASFVSSFHRGLNVTNTIAVVARGDTFTFYANGQRFAGPITDATYTQGTIGFFAEGGSEGGSGATTDVAFSNAKVWQL